MLDAFKPDKLTEPELVRTTLQSILMLHDLHYELKMEAESMVGTPNPQYRVKKMKKMLGNRLDCYYLFNHICPTFCEEMVEETSKKPKHVHC